MPVQVSPPIGRPDPRLPDKDIYSVIEPGRYGGEGEWESGVASTGFPATSVSDPDWIRIPSGRIRIQEGKNDPQNRRKS